MKLSTNMSKISGFMVVLALSSVIAFGQQKQEQKSTITVLPPTPNTPKQPAPPQQPAPAAQPAGQPAQPAAAAVPPGCPPQPATQKKEIKDQAEYNTYVNALGQANPGTKAQTLEQFLLQYPNTVVKDDALEALMGAYQQANDANKMQDAANRLLQVNPNAVRALALMAYTKRAFIEGTPNAATIQQDSQQLLKYGQQGLTALQCFPKPAGTSEVEFETQKKQMAAIFNGAAGSGALNQKDFANAQKYFTEAVQLDPNSLNDVYGAALAYLTPPIGGNPPAYNPTGLWYAARAVALGKGNVQLDKYGHYKYLKYHGADPADDHWKDLVAQAATQTAPPAGFTVPPAPTPAQQAQKLIDTKPANTMDFADLETVFGNAEPAASQKLLASIKGQPIQPFAAVVMQASPTQLSVAATQDAIEQKRADVIVNMVAAIPAKLLPKVGSQTGLTGSVESFTVGQAANPNDPNAVKPVVITMTEGKLVRTAPEPAPKKAPAHKGHATARHK
jgi:hypothetical protein